MSIEFVTDKPLGKDQLQALLRHLLTEGAIPKTAPLDNILKTYEEYERDPTKKFINKKYDLETGTVVEGEIARFNFALDYVAILTEKNEIYFCLDKSKIVCIYEYEKHLSATDLYLLISTYLDEFDIEIFLAADTSEVEAYIGCKVNT